MLVVVDVCRRWNAANRAAVSSPPPQPTGIPISRSTAPQRAATRRTDILALTNIVAPRKQTKVGACFHVPHACEFDADGLVSHTGDGVSFLSPTIVLRRHLYPAMAAAGIPRLGPTREKRTFQSFRHTFAKRALENGAQITWLSRHLGHSSLKVTTDIYGHWERAERKLQGAKMEGAFPV